MKNKALKLCAYLLLAALLLFMAAAIIIYPERYIKTTLQGFALWAECVLPSLFPFMVITLIFIKCGLADKASLPLKRATRLVNLPPAAAVCFIMSICSGYPAGARLVAELYENGAVAKSDCPRLAYICSTSGPLFIIGSVGYKMFAQKELGIAIFCAHAAAVLGVGVLLSVLSKKRRDIPYAPPVKRGNALYDSFYSAVVSVAVAGGFIAFFVTAAAIFTDFGVLKPLQSFFCLFLPESAAGGLCTGLFESTAGCRALASSQCALSAPLAGFVITFGGISILFQQLCYLLKCGVSAFKFVSVKLLQAVICFALLLPFV